MSLPEAVLGCLNERKYGIGLKLVETTIARVDGLFVGSPAEFSMDVLGRYDPHQGTPCFCTVVYDPHTGQPKYFKRDLKTGELTPTTSDVIDQRLVDFIAETMSKIPRMEPTDEQIRLTRDAFIELHQNAVRF